MIEINGEKLHPRKINGKELFPRLIFMKKISTRGTIERLVTKRLLTPYYENGVKKRPINGSYNSRATFYDFKQYSKIDFNEV